MIEANAPVPLFSTNLSLVVDGTGTNLALTIATANIQANSALVMSTNLILGLAGFQTFTGGYTTSTAGGNKTWTIPMYEVPASYAFFQVAAFGAGKGPANVVNVARSAGKSAVVVALLVNVRAGPKGPPRGLETRTVVVGLHRIGSAEAAALTDGGAAVATGAEPVRVHLLGEAS